MRSSAETCSPWDRRYLCIPCDNTHTARGAPGQGKGVVLLQQGLTLLLKASLRSVVYIFVIGIQEMLVLVPFL